jgi:hypothetical protein
MKRLVPLLLAISLTACATTETPQSITAKSLLSSRQAVIASAATVDTLCKQKVMSMADCMAAKKAYEQFQACYGAASDTFILYVQKGDGDYNSLVSQVVACQQSFTEVAK